MKKRYFKLVFRQSALIILAIWLSIMSSIAADFFSTGNGEFSTMFPLASLTSGDNIYIQNGHTITVNGINDYSSITNLTITIQSGGILELNDILGLLILGTGSSIVVDTGGQITTTGVAGGITTGISIFPDGIIPPAYAPILGDSNPLNGPSNVTSAGTVTLGLLYSISSGNWNSSGTWSASSGGASCGCTPTATDLAIVENAHTINIATNSESAGLTILNGGSVAWTSGSTLTIQNSGNIAIEATGTLDENGQTGAAIFLNNSATSSITNAGSMIIDILTYNVNTVSIHIVNSGTLTVNNTLSIGASSNITNLNSANMTFQDMDGGNNDFTFDNSGTITMNGAFLNMGGAESLNNKTPGIWNYSGATFAVGTQLYCDVDGANTFTYNLTGAQNIITPQDSYWHLALDNSGAKSLQGNINIKGDLNITDPASLSAGANGVTFNGTVAQNINISAANSINFNNITLNNTSGIVPSISVGATVTSLGVSNVITFIQGVLDVSSTTNGLIYSGPDIVAGSAGNPNSFIDGSFQVTTAGDFVFPTGDGSKWARIGISTLSGSETFTATYNLSVYPDVTVSGLSHVSGYEHWILDRAGTQSAFVTLYWEDGSPAGSDITDILSADLVVARYNAVDWVSEGQGTITGTLATGTIRTAAAVTNFSPFTFGSLNGINPLPIELTSFTGRQEGQAVQLAWETATEINNDFFALERSYDGLAFKTIATVNGSGNTSKPATYTFKDYPAFSGVIYYRLTQTDFDGASETFDVTAVQYEATNASITAYPNPLAGEDLTVLLPRNPKGKVSIQVYSVSGKLIYHRELTNPENIISLNLNQHREKGLYILQVETETSSYKTKIYLE